MTEFSDEGKSFNVIELHTHPKFDEKTTDYDVSVLKVDGIMEGHNIESIYLSDLTPEMLVGKLATVSGYGTLNVCLVCLV